MSRNYLKKNLSIKKVYDETAASCFLFRNRMLYRMLCDESCRKTRTGRQDPMLKLSKDES